MQKTNNLQDIFLAQARRERRTVTLFLMNGFQMRGVITGFDAFVVVLTTDGKQQIIYKHAISTIVPERPLPYTTPCPKTAWADKSRPCPSPSSTFHCRARDLPCPTNLWHSLKSPPVRKRDHP